MKAELPRLVPTTIATRMYPACAMLEYARRRLIFLWARATRLPTIIVSAASHHTASCQVDSNVGKASSQSRKNAANAAAFTAAAMYAVIEDGAPSSQSDD